MLDAGGPAQCIPQDLNACAVYDAMKVIPFRAPTPKPGLNINFNLVQLLAMLMVVPLFLMVGVYLVSISPVVVASGTRRLSARKLHHAQLPAPRASVLLGRLQIRRWRGA